MMFHVLGLPHTVSTKEYSSCAFTQKVVRMCAMLHRRGYGVIHYGHRDSNVECAEHVSVSSNEVLEHAYPGWDWKRQGFPQFRGDDYAYTTFYERVIPEVGKRKQPGDFLLCMFGEAHKPVALAHRDMIVCEPGIGYGSGHFAPFKVFESYAILHAYHGLKSVTDLNDRMWYDAVIPNSFDVGDFTYSPDKDDYLLHFTRNDSKGTRIARRIAEVTGYEMVVVGPNGHDTDRGVVGVQERKGLLSRAKAVLAPSIFVEPFCGVQVEAFLSGTPVVSTDWGAFTEYNVHGITGYRCRTFEQFTWAVNNVHTIKPWECWHWGYRNFSMERVGAMYEEYFDMVRRLTTGGGWYASNPERIELDWLQRF
jgi:glycosyl transferase family 1